MKKIVGVFKTEAQAINAIESLKKNGYSSDEISVVAKNPEQMENISTTTDTVGEEVAKGAGAGMVTGGLLGGIGALILELGAFTIPGIGPLMAAGPFAATIAGIAAGGAAGGLVGALIGLGIDESEASIYNTHLSEGDILVLVEGDERRANVAYTAFRSNQAVNAGLYPTFGGANTVETAVNTVNHQPIATVPNEHNTMSSSNAFDTLNTTGHMQASHMPEPLGETPHHTDHNVLPSQKTLDRQEEALYEQYRSAQTAQPYSNTNRPSNDLQDGVILPDAQQTGGMGSTVIDPQIASLENHTTDHDPNSTGHFDHPVDPSSMGMRGVNQDPAYLDPQGTQGINPNASYSDPMSTNGIAPDPSAFNPESDSKR